MTSGASIDDSLDIDALDLTLIDWIHDEFVLPGFDADYRFAVSQTNDIAPFEEDFCAAQATSSLSTTNQSSDQVILDDNQLHESMSFTYAGHYSYAPQIVGQPPGRAAAFEPVGVYAYFFVYLTIAYAEISGDHGKWPDV